MHKMQAVSPLRYPGGKSRLVPFFDHLIEINNLAGGTYVEPYAGGASIALSLLLDHKVEKVIINDLDRSIYAFWYTILNHNAEFCDMIRNVKLTPDEWLIQKDIQRKKKSADLLELGLSTFYLNRTNRSGILNAWPIGGIKQDGAWKMDARFYRETLVKRVETIGQNSENIELHNEDAVNLIRKHLKSLDTSSSLVYMDPPYFKKGPWLYLNHYRLEDHQALASFVKDMNHHWVISYDPAPDIVKMYKEFRRMDYDLRYTARTSRQTSEVFFFSHSLSL